MYKPREKTRIILDRAFEMVQSVPYSVSSRWLFYKLLQEGYYSDKKHYKDRWNPAVSKARKNFYNDWTPYTLEDATRQAFILGDGFTGSPEAWLPEHIKMIADVENHNTASCKWQYQNYYIELWFEARAMYKQFAYYTENIPLVPMGGQASIPYKWECAKRLESTDKPVVVLYFGDLDKGGDDIAGAVEKDVTRWSDTSFEFIHCGLNLEQAKKYGIPEFEKWDKKNKKWVTGFQWEALSDQGAREIITEATAQFISLDGIKKGEQIDKQARELLQERLNQAFGGRK